MMSFSGKGQAAAMHMTSKSLYEGRPREGAKGTHICPPHPDCAPPHPPNQTQGLWRGCQLTPTLQLHTPTPPSPPVRRPPSLNAVCPSCIYLHSIGRLLSYLSPQSEPHPPALCPPPRHQASLQRPRPRPHPHISFFCAKSGFKEFILEREK